MAGLDDALTLNRDAAQRFLATARAVPPERWVTPVAPGKWSPAQIVDHVATSTEVAPEGDPRRQGHGLDLAGRRAFEHGFFGRVKVADYIRFNGLHTRHHEQELR